MTGKASSIILTKELQSFLVMAQVASSGKDPCTAEILNQKPVMI